MTKSEQDRLRADGWQVWDADMWEADRMKKAPTVLDAIADVVLRYRPKAKKRKKKQKRSRKA